MIRRLRRFYRVYKDGDIVYSEVPKNKKDNEQKSDEVKEQKNDYRGPKNIIINTINVSRDDFNKNFKQNKNNKKKEEKDKLINAILKEIEKTVKNNVEPDVNVISETIYEQLKKNNVKVDQETIKDVINKKRSHYRANKINEKNAHDLNILDVKADRNSKKEELTFILEDIYEQIEKEIFHEKNDKGSKSNLSKEVKEKKDKEKTENEKKDKKLNLDFDEEIDSSDSGDDLGLKF